MIAVRSDRPSTAARVLTCSGIARQPARCVSWSRDGHPETMT